MGGAKTARDIRHAADMNVIMQDVFPAAGEEHAVRIGGGAGLVVLLSDRLQGRPQQAGDNFAGARVALFGGCFFTKTVFLRRPPLWLKT